MSIIRAIKHRLGLSVTPANNFVLDASADNGTMKLARESGQDIMTVDAAGKVAFPQMAQTWQVMTGSRAVNTDYTNNTGQPITISIYWFSSATASATITCQGVFSDRSGYTSGGASGTLRTTVPAGATYRMEVSAGTPTITSWTELR